MTKSRVFIFPGQGAQLVGRGYDLYQNFIAAKDVFHEVDEALGKKLSDIIFHGPNELLNLTRNTQPALMTICMAFWKIIQNNNKISDLCKYVTGHSLGEYTALCVANSISLGNTAKILDIRAQLMQECGEGGMAACFDISLQELEELLNKWCKGYVCEIANDNGKNQIVISGHNEAINIAMAQLKELGKKTIKLKVSGPFHSSLMIPATYKLEKIFQNIQLDTPEVSIINNITAIPTRDVKIIKNCLIQQLSSKLNWRQIIEFLYNDGVTEIVEIGSKVLTNMIKRDRYDFNLISITNIKELENFLKF